MTIFDTNDPEYEAVYAQEAAMIDASELIAEALEKSGMTRAELARTLNVSKGEITARLKGERNITVRKLAETLHALGARLDLSMSYSRPHTTNTSHLRLAAFKQRLSARKTAERQLQESRLGATQIKELIEPR